MYAGLDIGTNSISLAVKSSNKECSIFTHKTAVLAIPEKFNTKLFLEKYKSSYLKIGETIYIVGEDAVYLANIFSKEISSPIINGTINPKEPNATALLGGMIKQLIEKADLSKETLIVFNLPAPPLDNSFDTVHLKYILESIFSQLNMKCKAIYSAQGAAYFDLIENDITGITINLGAGLVNVCCSYLSIPAVNFSTDIAGDWVDAKASKVLNIAVANIMQDKHGLNISAPTTEAEVAISVYITDMIKQVVNLITERFSLSNRDCPKYDKPIIISLSGGLVKNESVASVFKKHLSEQKMALPISAIEISQNPEYGTAIGCLLVAAYEAGDITNLNTTEVEVIKDLTNSEIESNIEEI